MLDATVQLPGPPGHGPTGVQLSALVPLLDWPAGQSVHTRSAVAEGGLDTKVPASQVLHGAHDAASGVPLKVPSAQSAHTVSLALVAGALT
jgi:hypothetical protein